MGKNFIFTNLFVILAIFNLTAQNSESKKEKYVKIGLSARTFNNSSFKEDIGEFLGLEIQGGIQNS